MTETPRWSARSSGVVALLLAALIALFFADPIFTGRTFFYRDLGLAVRPVLEEARQAPDGGVDALPLWTHHLSQGRPLLANPGYALLHPMSALYLVLPFNAAFNAFIVLHVLVAALGMAALARHCGASPAAGFAAGACFALGGPFLSTTNLYPTLASAAWAPLTLLAGVAACEKPRAWRVGLLALCLAVQALGGQPEPVLMTAAVGFAWCAVVAGPAGRLRRPARAALVWCVAGTWAFLLAAPQVLPSLHLARGSVRSLGFTARAVTEHSVEPLRALGLVVPPDAARALGAFGSRSTLPVGTPFGPYLLTIYLGMAALTLAAVGVALRKRSGEGGGRTLLQRSAVPLAILAMAGATLSLGRHLPGFEEVVGMLRSPLRYPVKLTFVAGLAVPLLAALGVDVLSRRARARAGSVAVLLAALAGADLFIGHRAVAPTAHLQTVESPQPLLEELQRLARAHGIEDDQWRIYHQRTAHERPIPAGVMRSDDPAGGLLRWQRRMLLPGTALPGDLHHAHERVGDQLDLLDYFLFSRQIHLTTLGVGGQVEARGSFHEMAAALGRCGVLFVIAAPTLERETGGVLARVHDLDPASGFPVGSGTLYRNTAFVPRATLDGSGTIVSLEENHRGLEIDVRTDGGGTLVLSDALSDGWKAEVDGARVEIEHRDGGTRAVAVPAGASEVRFRYVPPGLVPGAILCAFGVAALVAAAISRR